MNGILEQISLYYYGRDYKLGELIIDAVISENFDFKADVSEHPTEEGNSFSDHVFLQPLSIKISGIISNTPLDFIGKVAFNSLNNFIHQKSNDRICENYIKLESLFNKKEPIDIVTSLKIYNNMIVDSFHVERSPDKYEALCFDITAKQIRTIKQQKIKIPQKARVADKKNLGNQDVAKKIVEEPNRSFAKSAWGFGSESIKKLSNYLGHAIPKNL